MNIVWDNSKRTSNIAKHGMDFADLTPEFFESSTVYPAKGNRFIAVGELGGVIIITVVFRPLGSEAVSVISMRPASKKERNLQCPKSHRSTSLPIRKKQKSRRVLPAIPTALS